MKNLKKLFSNHPEYILSWTSLGKGDTFEGVKTIVLKERYSKKQYCLEDFYKLIAVNR